MDPVVGWLKRIDEGLKYRRVYGRDALWGEIETLFFHAAPEQKESIGPNLLASNGDTLLSNLSIAYPHFLVTPRQEESLRTAPIVESCLNSLVYTLDLQQEVAQAVQCAYLWGVGILKHGYDSEWGFDPRFDIMGGEGGITLTQHARDGRRIEFADDVNPGMPWVRMVLPHDIVVPWGAPQRLQRAPWIAHRVIRHIDDVRADVKYKGGGLRGLEPNISMQDFVRSYLNTPKPYRLGQEWTPRMRWWSEDGEQEFVELWEIHDKQTGRVVVIASGHDSVLRDEVDLLQVHGLPFTAVHFVPHPRTFWTTPDTVYIRPMQSELDDIAEHRRRQRRARTLRFLAEEGAMSPEQQDRLLSGEVGVYATYRQGVTADKAITALIPPADYSLDTEEEAVRRAAREVLGISRNQSGEFEQRGRRTATEAAEVSRRSDVRMDRRELSVRKCYVELGQKLLAIIGRFWKTHHFAHVIGETGAMEWIAYTGAELRGDYALEVTLSSEPPMTLEARRQQAIAIFMQLSADPTIDPIALRQYLARAFNDPGFSSLFKPGVLNASLSVPMQPVQQASGSPSPRQPVQPANGV